MISAEKKLLDRYNSMFKNLNISRPPGIIDHLEFIKSCRQVEFVSPDCDEGWELKKNSKGIQKFTHPRYKDKNGRLKMYNVAIESSLDKKNKLVKRILYPAVDPNLDIYEIGYSFCDGKPISNKFESFWDTRRGRRYSKYIQYRKYRDMIKEQHHPGSTDQPKKNKVRDPEFEKYLIEKNEKKRIMQELLELEMEEEKKMNAEYGYDSDDYNY